MSFPYTPPSGIWPTPPKTAKKGRNNAKALGHRLLAKRPGGQAGSGGAILAFLRGVVLIVSSYAKH